MNVPKAVITAAGPKQRHLPLQTIADSEARNRNTLGLLVDEVKSAGINELGIVIAPDTEGLYRDAATEADIDITFIEQTEARGYGHAVLSASEFTGDDAFMLIVSDHLYVSDLPDRTCAQQLVEIAKMENCMVSAVQATHESHLPDFGALGGSLFEGRDGLYEVKEVLEKPSPTVAEQRLLTPGLRHGYYLCFFGMHVLTPDIMPILRGRLESLPQEEILQLTDSLNAANEAARYLAPIIRGRRYDLDSRYGILMAQLAFALDGSHREEVLAGIIELMAQTGA